MTLAIVSHAKRRICFLSVELVLVKRLRVFFMNWTGSYHEEKVLAKKWLE